jgi:penicillin amidase
MFTRQRTIAAILVLAVVGMLPRNGIAQVPDAAYALLEKARTVLARVDGDVTVPGLREPVEVLRDRWGVAHIYAKNTDDLFFAQGFVAAQDRLFQIDLWRRIAVGEISELLGRDGWEGDRFARLINYRGDMDAEWASYSPDARQIVTAFTRGINAYIDSIGDRLPIEFQVLKVRPKKWRPEDCLGRMAGIVMTRNFQSEVSRAELIAAVGVENARMLMPTDPVRPFAPVPGFDLTGIGKSVLAGYTAATRSMPLRPGDGSNNWVVDGTLSVSGKPLLASDPHRALGLPSLRYLVHLNAPGWNVIGSGEPALPGVAIGHNSRVAWGFTIVGTDQADLYVEQTDPRDSTQYKVGDNWERMTIVREKVAVRGEVQPPELELRFTRHGPVIHQNAAQHRAYALKWVGAEPGGAAYLASLAFDRAESAGEFSNALAAWKSPSENMVFADVDGHIGWIAAGLAPVRGGWDGLLPVPGDSGRYEWQGFRPLAQLPHAFDPPAHFIHTANHNILPPGDPDPISFEWAPRFRAERIRQRLQTGNKVDLKEFQSIQYDDTTLPGLALVKLLRDGGVPDVELKPYVELLISWNGSLSADSRAGALYGIWLRELLDALYRPRVPAGLVEGLVTRGGVPVLLAALERPDRAWFGDHPEQGRDALLRRTLRAAVGKARETLGEDLNQWTWGKLHTLTFRHALAALGPTYAAAFNLGPVPRPGDAHTLNAATHDAKFAQTSGASYRHVLDLADWDRGLATSTPGQSGQPGSPHYADLLPLWQRGEYFPLAFSRTKVEEVSQHRLRLIPVAP